MSSRFRIGLTFLVLLAAGPLRAGEQTKEPQSGGGQNMAWEAFALRARAYFRKIDDALGRFELGLRAGFMQHQAGETNFLKLDLGASLSQDSYPHQIRFDTGTSFVIQNDSYQENVSALRLNYDRYLAPWLESFGFVERFTDSYLSIQQRFEVGAGLKVEWRVFPDRDRLAEEGRDLAEAVDRELETFAASPEVRRDPGLRRQVSNLERERDRVWQFLRRSLERLELGLAVNVFSEIEQAALETFLDPAGTSVKITLDGEHRLRYVVRPSFAFRPSESLTFRGQFYWKGPLGSPQRRDGRLDYRYDTLLSAEFGLPVSAGWAKKLLFKVEHKIHYDHCPPRIPALVQAEYSAQGGVLRATEARPRHAEFSLSLELKI
jgi:hypothetical protein